MNNINASIISEIIECIKKSERYDVIRDLKIRGLLGDKVLKSILDISSKPSFGDVEDELPF